MRLNPAAREADRWPYPLFLVVCSRDIHSTLGAIVQLFGTDMNQQIVLALAAGIFGILGVVAGSVLTYVFSKRIINLQAQIHRG